MRNQAAASGRSTQFKGVITALATPFFKGAVDFDSLAKLIGWQLQQGVDGFVIHGTTAESPTVTNAEKKEIFDFVKKKVPASFPLIVGTGTNSTADTIKASQEAEKWGADALLVVVPYYNKPPQRGLFEHFKAVASCVSIPTILYNVPSRTITSLEADTVKKLSEHPNIIGIKEATGDLSFARQLRAMCGSQFLLLSGDDATCDDFQKQGGDGVISVASHLIPAAMKTLSTGNYREVVDLLFAEANPIPLKRALQLMGIFRSGEMRLPLVEFSAQGTEKLKAAMVSAGILK